MNVFMRRNPPSLDDLAVDDHVPSWSDNLSSECLMPSVDRPKQIFVRGQGSWLWDCDERAYLDFTQGGGGPIALDTALRPWSMPSRRKPVR